MVFVDTIFSIILTFFIIYYITFYIFLVYCIIEEEWFCKNRLPGWRDYIILKYKRWKYSRLVNIIEQNDLEIDTIEVCDAGINTIEVCDGGIKKENKVFANEIIKQIDLNIQPNSNNNDKQRRKK